MPQDHAAELHHSIRARDLPPAPLTLEGSSALHQMFRIKWAAWNAMESEHRREIAAEAAGALEGMEANGESAAYSLIGHKGDLMLLHFRDSFDDLNRAELAVAQLKLAEYLEPATSYLSVVELGLYDASLKLFAALAERGTVPHSAEWNAAVEEQLSRQREAMKSRLYPKVPAQRYICFYPMDRRRGEEKNFYSLSMMDRGRMMREHGLVGRRYAEKVQQIITGSMGFDDWEWGVDLFSEDPLAFKKLIYEMRFDEVSAVYAMFGSFYVGIRCPAAKLPELLLGNLPSA